MKSIDEKALQAATDENILSDLITEQTAFIINCAYKTTNKYITQSDDEWSIALIAFSNAVKTYDIKKGHFLSYAKVLITNSLTDYYRKHKKYFNEISVDPYSFQTNPEDNEYDIKTKIEISEKLSTSSEHNLKHEIEAANTEFKKFGFSFFNLAKCSPKSIKTRSACKTAVNYVLSQPFLINELYTTKQISIKIVQKNTELPRKTLEFYRRYIISAIIILSGDYPLLQEYYAFIVKGD